MSVTTELTSVYTITDGRKGQREKVETKEVVFHEYGLKKRIIIETPCIRHCHFFRHSHEDTYYKFSFLAAWYQLQT